MSTMGSPTLELEKKRKRRKLVVRQPMVDDGASTDSTQASVKRTDLEEVADSVGVVVPSVGMEVGDGKVGVVKEIVFEGKVGAGKEGVSVPNVEATTVTQVAPMTQGNAGSMVAKMKGISKDVLALAQSDGMNVATLCSLMGYVNGYEELIFSLIAENERLKGSLEAGRLEVGRSATSSYAQVLGGKQKAVPLLPQQGRPGAVLLAPPLSKPVNTWSVVVRGKNTGTSAKDVADKVMKEVRPSLGVRVHEVKPLRDGGVIIRTPSLAEREKLTTNEKFAEVGLSVAVNEKPKPRAVVQGLNKRISCDNFMAELYTHNLKDKMTHEEFKSNFRVVTKPWEADDGVVNVVLEGTATAIDYLVQCETCYVKWFYLKVRSFDPVVACFRCLGLG